MYCVLHVEDNRGDIMLTKEAFNSIEMDIEFVEAYDGRKGLEYLRSGNMLPDLILLDINMPVLNGKEFLSEIKSDAKLRNIPVVVLTTSTDDRDIKDCYALYANAYINKTLDFMGFQKCIQDLAHFWFSHNVYVKND